MRIALFIAGLVALTVVTGCSGCSPYSGSSSDNQTDAIARDAAPPDPSCTRSGCLRAAVKIGDYGADQLRAVIDPRVSIDNGYSVWAIEYATRGRSALATVTFPFGVAAPAGGWPIVANNHGTTGLDDPCKTTWTVYGAGLSGLFGARGMIGVAPDYPGLGTPGILPYLVSEVEGAASLDALRATRDLASANGVPISNRYAVAGLSEGGHATIAAAALHALYAPELDIRAFAAAAPASVYEEDWRAGLVDGPLVPFEAMLVYAWSDYYGGPSPWAEGFAPTVRNAMTTQCVGASGSAGGIGSALGTTEVAKVFAPSFVTAFRSGVWGAYDAFGRAFAANRLGPYKQTAPLKIYQGDADVDVYEASTRALVAALGAGGVDVDYEVVAGGTHFDVAFGFLASFERRTAASIAWIRARLSGP